MLAVATLQCAFGRKRLKAHRLSHFCSFRKEIMALPTPAFFCL
jgi:hypothetical protein